MHSRGAAAEPERELYLAGSGSFAVEVGEWARDAGWRIAGMIEMVDPARVGQRTAELPVLAVEDAPPGARAVVALGGDRGAHWARLEQFGWQPATLVHPRAHVSATAQLAPGCIVAPGAVLGAGTAIGRHTLISRGALLGHHVIVGAFASILPGANLGGGTRIGEAATIGMGAVVVNGIEVGPGATVAAGAVVVRSVREGVRAQGVPAREYAG